MFTYLTRWWFQNLFFFTQDPWGKESNLTSIFFKNGLKPPTRIIDLPTFGWFFGKCIGKYTVRPTDPSWGCGFLDQQKNGLDVETSLCIQNGKQKVELKWIYLTQVTKTSSKKKSYPDMFSCYRKWKLSSYPEDPWDWYIYLHFQ